MAIEKNSEILFVYDAKKTNPNGDMDDENKPRMDHQTDTNLVSDVRLKRYVRDYLEDFKEKELFVNDDAEDAKAKVEKTIDRKTSKQKPITKEELKRIKDRFIDIKFFGAVLGTEGGSDHFTGPIQFNWGYSLNKVELQETKTITSKFSDQKGVGKDFRVKYSLIAFSGGINANRVSDEEENKVKLENSDVELFDTSLIKSIPLHRTRSKIGQMPRLYIRVELKDKQSFLKDLREFVKIDREKEYNSIEDVELDLTPLSEYMKKNDGLIETIHYYKDENLTTKGFDFEQEKCKKIEI